MRERSCQHRHPGRWQAFAHRRQNHQDHRPCKSSCSSSSAASPSGMIYGVIAFGYQLTFATSKTLNFGQGEALMIGALVGLTVASFIGYWAMLPVVLVFGMAQGAAVEWLGVRQAIKMKSESGWIMATIAIGIILKNVAENVWGRDDLKFPSPLSGNPDQPGRRPHPADGDRHRLRRAAADAGRRGVQPPQRVRQGRRGDGKRPRRRRPDGHQHQAGHHLQLRAEQHDRRLRRRPGGAGDADRRHDGRGAGPQGVRRRHHRRPVIRPGRHRRRADPGHHRNH